MGSLASINVKFSADLKQFSSEMQTALREIDKAGQKFKQIGTSLSTYVTLPILAAGAAAVKFATDYNESLNKVDASFKGSSEQVKQFAKTSLETSGIAEGTALDMAAAYGDMATSMGMSTNQAAKMSTSLVTLAGDLASFKNIGIDQANTALTAIFTGETESLKKLGIVITEVNLKQYALNTGIKKNFEVMTQAEKVQLRYNYILSVTKNAQGDFARTSGGAANQTRIFFESLKQVGQQIGQVILPVFIKIITAINEKIKAFGGLSVATKTVIVVVAGLVAVIGPLLVVIGAVLSAIPAIVAGFTLISGAIVPILAGVVLLAGVINILANATKEATKEVVELSSSQKLVQKVTDEATSSIVDQKSQLELLLLTARNENETKAARLKAIQAINRISPEYLGNLTLENINTDKARVSIEKYNAALLSGATARAASRLLEENQSDKIKAGFEREKALADYNEKRKVAISKGWEAEKAFYEENNRLLQFANEALDRKNAKYDSEAKILTDIYDQNKKNLDLLNDNVVTSDVTAPEKVKKHKNIEPIKNEITTRISSGTAQAYDAEIAKLQEFRDQVATTAAQVKMANDAIKNLEFGKALNFDPTSLITGGGTDKNAMIKDLEARQNGLKAVAESTKVIMLDISSQINAAVEGLAESAAVGLGEAIGALATGSASMGDVMKGMLSMIGDFMKSLGKSLIQVGIASEAFKKAFSNPYLAIAAGIALVALGSVVQAKFKEGPKFENGGIVGGSSFHGDKILARVNSGEMVANADQQRKIWGAMNSGGGSQGGFVASTVLKGSDMLVVIERATERKNRIG